MIDVTVRDCTIEEVDSEICVVAGCALGFVAPRAPPHVLHVEENSTISREGVEMDDVLLYINDKEVAHMQKAEVIRALVKSKGSMIKLSFAKGSAIVDGEPDMRRENREMRERERSPVREIRDVRLRSRSPPYARRTAVTKIGGHSFQPPPERPPMWWDRNAEQNIHDPGWGKSKAWERRPDVGRHVDPRGVPGVGYCPLPPRPMGLPPTHIGSMSVPPSLPQSHLSRPPPGAPATTIVAERVPESLLVPEVVDHFFSKFGPLAHVAIDKARKQAVIDFVDIVDAERAVASNEPILGDSVIYLRFFRGARPQPTHPTAHHHHHQPPTMPQQTHHHGRRPPMSQPAAPSPKILQDNMVLETPEAQNRRKTREESLNQKKELMQKITDKMKVVMSRLTDPNVSEEQRDQLQDLLMTLKQKLTALTTPKVPPKPVTASNVLDLRSKVLRIEFKSPVAKDTDLAVALKEVCAEVNWTAPDLTLTWEEQDGVETPKAALVTFADRRAAEVAQAALPKNLVAAAFE